MAKENSKDYTAYLIAEGISLAFIVLQTNQKLGAENLANVSGRSARQGILMYLEIGDGGDILIDEES